MTTGRAIREWGLHDHCPDCTNKAPKEYVLVTYFCQSCAEGRSVRYRIVARVKAQGPKGRAARKAARS